MRVSRAARLIKRPRALILTTAPDLVKPRWHGRAETRAPESSIKKLAGRRDAVCRHKRHQGWPRARDKDEARGNIFFFLLRLRSAVGIREIRGAPGERVAANGLGEG